MTKTLVLFGFLTLAVVLLGMFVTSSSPDGLNRVAWTLGFASLARQAGEFSPLAGYEARFVRETWLAQATAGLVGVLVLFAFGTLLGRLIRKRGG